MLRLLLLGTMVLVIGAAFRNSWVEVHWDRILRDVNLPFLAEPDPTRRFNVQGQ